MHKEILLSLYEKPLPTVTIRLHDIYKQFHDHRLLVSVISWQQPLVLQALRARQQPMQERIQSVCLGS